MKLSQKGRTGFYKNNVDDVAARYDDINGMVNALELLTRGERFVQLGEKKQKRRLLLPDSGPIPMG